MPSLSSSAAFVPVEESGRLGSAEDGCVDRASLCGGETQRGCHVVQNAEPISADEHHRRSVAALSQDLRW